MPIYEYCCQSCGHEFETIQKISEARLTDCPECGKPELKKMVSAAGFKLKGSGWYETDFKNSGKAETKDKKESKKKSSGSSSSESKSATKKSGGGCGSGCGHSH